MFNLRHAHAPLLLHLLRLQLLVPHQLDVEAKGSSLQQVASKESSPQEVREVPGTTHVLHRVVEEADGVHNLGWFKVKLKKWILSNIPLGDPTTNQAQ